jgi:hypothetical protein
MGDLPYLSMFSKPPRWGVGGLIQEGLRLCKYLSFFIIYLRLPPKSPKWGLTVLINVFYGGFGGLEKGKITLTGNIS